MKILALDAATEACSAALWIDGEFQERFQIAPRQHAQLLIPMIEELLANASITLSSLDAIAFGRGPGSFTGVRIAMSTLQGLAFATELPVIPVSNLQALAQLAHRQFQQCRVMAAIDARMQEIYVALYQLDSNHIMQVIREEHVCTPIQFDPRGEVVYAGIGSGFDSYHELLKEKLTSSLSEVYFEQFPHARDIAEIGAYEFAQGNAISVFDAQPVYLRNKVTQ